MIPTPEMIEVYAKAIAFAGLDRNDVSEDATEFWAYTDDTKKARYRKMASAALALIPGDPVAWEYEVSNYMGGCDGAFIGWDKRFSAKKPSDAQGLRNLRPLYGAPAPLPVAVKIKPLEWKNRTAKTDAGVMYAISGHRKLGERGFILRIVSGLGTENHNIDDFDEAKAVAQQDYETRSRSPFSSPVGGMEETVTDALRRISELTPARANARTANDLHLTVKAIADTALAGISPTPASDIAALREENEKIRNAGIRFLKAADAYVDGEDIPEETLMVEYGDALDAFRSALQHVAKGERG